ncbi:hypothetical protein PoMZ_08981, partial [Pyricularia oryzae]
WKSSLPADQAWRDSEEQACRRELRQLLEALPDRFHAIVKQTLESLPKIFSLPVVLIHGDFGFSNIFVDEPDCHLVGVVDWAEAAPGIFGTNLCDLWPLSGKLMLETGLILFEDHNSLQETFWGVLSSEIGGLTDEQVQNIKAARTLGLLRVKGFTSRLKNMPEPVPIGRDENGLYNMLYLDGLLLNQATRYQ